MSAPAVVFVVCVAACAVAHVAIVVSSVSARASTASPAVPRPRVAVEFIWALLPILALALVFTATWARVSDRERHPHETMKVAQ